MKGFDHYYLLSLVSIFSIGLSGLFVIGGFFSIKKKRVPLHKKFMLSATFFSFIFLVLYLLKTLLFEQRHYQGEFRTLYLSILTFHSILASLNIPLVLLTLFFALKKDFSKHRKIARITAPCWILTSLSGWIIFLFLI